MTEGYLPLSVFILGLIIGSFLNVCIYRIPRGFSIVRPPSSCPSCKSPVRIYDNIPVISYILLRGRCRSCSSAIPLRYPVVELLNAVLYVSIIWRFGSGWHTPVYFVFCSAMVVITFIDLEFQIIPDAITLSGIPLGLIAGSLILIDPFFRASMLGFNNSFTGLVSGGGLFYLIAVLSRGGMGGGDIKMMAMTGAFLGWKAVLLTTFSASLIGSIAGIILIVFKGKGRKTKIPFGPFLAAGALITLFFGQEILRFYLMR